MWRVVAPAREFGRLAAAATWCCRHRRRPVGPHVAEANQTEDREERALHHARFLKERGYLREGVTLAQATRHPVDLHVRRALRPARPAAWLVAAEIRTVPRRLHDRRTPPVRRLGPWSAKWLPSASGRRLDQTVRPRIVRSFNGALGCRVHQTRRYGRNYLVRCAGVLARPLARVGREELSPLGGRWCGR